MYIKSFTFNPFQENTYVLYDDTKECLIVDPGCYDSNEQGVLNGFIQSKGLRPVRLLNTHAHIDHIFGNAFIATKYSLEVELNRLDFPTFNLAKRSADLYQLNYTPSPQPIESLNDGSMLKFGNTQLEVILIPGHAPGHVVFYNEHDATIIGGDVLFQNSIGRTDLPGGNHQDLITNIQERLFVLPDEVKVYPGHGSNTTIGHEKRHNPFF